jgi:hypothetical protein
MPNTCLSIMTTGIVTNLRNMPLKDAVCLFLSRAVNYAVTLGLMSVDILFGVEKAVGDLPKKTADKGVVTVILSTANCNRK